LVIFASNSTASYCYLLSQKTFSLPSVAKNCGFNNDNNNKLEIWGTAQREAAWGVRKQALINF